MARNIEIKARARDLARLELRARELGGGAPEELVQVDTFYAAPSGRLKLRVFGDGTGELIQYDRPDRGEPAESRYERSPAADPASLHAALEGALGVRAVVRKRRRVVLVGQTRVHLDEVEGLGSFLELEVVLAPDQTTADGAAIARRLMGELGVRAQDLIPGAYVDELEALGSTTREHVHEESFAVPSERLFALLHTPAAIRAWWGVARAIVSPEVGGTFAAAWGADEDDPDFVTVGTITRFEPPRRLVLADYRYRAKTGPLPFEAEFETEFLVTPAGAGATLRVTQSGFPADSAADEFLDGCRQGWRDTFARIRRYLDGPVA